MGETASVAGAVPLSEAAFESVFGVNTRKLDSYQKAFDARITGFPFELPGGGVGVSVGAEYRDEGFKVIDSPEIFVGSVPIALIDRGRGISSYFGEIRIPIVGSEMNVPFVRSLEVSAAGRHDHYEGVRKDADVPKLTLRYQPIEDLTIRATYSQSFVAPTLYQLYGPLSSGFTAPVSLHGTPQDQPQAITGGNPLLTPSTAESYTAGIVYSPHFLHGLTITGDFFKTLQRTRLAPFRLRQFSAVSRNSGQPRLIITSSRSATSQRKGLTRGIGRSCFSGWRPRVARRKLGLGVHHRSDAKSRRTARNGFRHQHSLSVGSA